MLDPDANRLGMSLTGSYPVKISVIKDLETLEILSDYYPRFRRESTSTSRLSYHRSFFSSFRERERKWYKSKEYTH